MKASFTCTLHSTLLHTPLHRGGGIYLVADYHNVASYNMLHKSTLTKELRIPGSSPEPLFAGCILYFLKVFGNSSSYFKISIFRFLYELEIFFRFWNLRGSTFLTNLGQRFPSLFLKRSVLLYLITFSCLNFFQNHFSAERASTFLTLLDKKLDSCWV